jgi:hypothetical protein
MLSRVRETPLVRSIRYRGRIRAWLGSEDGLETPRCGDQEHEVGVGRRRGFRFGMARESRDDGLDPYAARSGVLATFRRARHLPAPARGTCSPTAPIGERRVRTADLLVRLALKEFLIDPKSEFSRVASLQRHVSLGHRRRFVAVSGTDASWCYIFRQPFREILVVRIGRSGWPSFAQVPEFPGSNTPRRCPRRIRHDRRPGERRSPGPGLPGPAGGRRTLARRPASEPPGRSSRVSPPR